MNLLNMNKSYMVHNTRNKNVTMLYEWEAVHNILLLLLTFPGRKKQQKNNHTSTVYWSNLTWHICRRNSNKLSGRVVDDGHLRYNSHAF